MGRRRLVVGLVAACAPHFDGAAHTGRDGEPWGARRLHLDDGVARIDGIVTARGGDAADWVAFEVPPRCAGRSLGANVDLELRWQAPRRGLRVSVAAFDAHLQPIGVTRWRMGHARVSLGGVPTGHYFARVYAPRPDDAGVYDLRIERGADDCMPLPRAWSPPPPPPPPLPPPPLVVPVPKRISHPPVEAALASVRAPPSGDALIVLDRGRADGIEVGWRGVLMHASGVPVPGGTFDVVQVDFHRSIGVAPALVITDKDSLRAFVAP